MRLWFVLDETLVSRGSTECAGAGYLGRKAHANVWQPFDHAFFEGPNGNGWPL